MMKKLKIILIALVALLVVIMVLQNTESVKTKFLFVSIEMPRAALLFGTFVAGFVVGLLTAGRIGRSARR